MSSEEDKEAQENEIAILNEILDQDDLLVNHLDSGVTCGTIKIRIDFEHSPLKCQYLKIQEQNVNDDDEGEEKKKKENENNNVDEVLEEQKVDNGQANSSQSMEKKKNTVTTSPKIVVDKLTLKYVPPLILHFTLPTDYPSSQQPIFTLSCKWIGRKSLSKLCGKLDRLWKENEGMAILYTWYTFLQDDLKTVLNIGGQDAVHDLTFYYHSNNISVTNKNKAKRKPRNEKTVDCDNKPSSITTTPTTNTKMSNDLASSSSNSSPRKIFNNKLDSRAVFERVNEPIHEYLLKYETEEKERQFLKSNVPCEICCEEKRGVECLQLECEHIYCKNCLQHGWTLHITEGSLDNIKCPGFKCQVIPYPHQVKYIVDSEVYERYDRLLLSKSLDNMTDVISCPRISCGQPVVLEGEGDTDKLAKCLYCEYSFCRLCKKAFHGVEPCRMKDMDAKKLYHVYTHGSAEEKKQLEKKYGKKQLGVLIEQTLSEDWVSKQAKRCPSCSAPIQKFEGCNKVTCFKCSAYFCWICSKALSKDNPYLHFNDPSSPCYNNLFENVRPEQNGGEDEDNDEEWWDEDDDSDEDDPQIFLAAAGILQDIRLLRNVHLQWM